MLLERLVKKVKKKILSSAQFVWRKKNVTILLLILFVLLYWKFDVVYSRIYVISYQGQFIEEKKIGNIRVSLYKNKQIKISDEEIDKIFITADEACENLDPYLNSKFLYQIDRSSDSFQLKIILVAPKDYCLIDNTDNCAIYFPDAKKIFIRWDDCYDNLNLKDMERTVHHELFHFLIDINNIQLEEFVAEDFASDIDSKKIIIKKPKK